MLRHETSSNRSFSQFMNTAQIYVIFMLASPNFNIKLFVENDGLTH